MRNLLMLDIYRDRSPHVVSYMGGIGDETCGVFTVPSHIDGAPMCVIASSGMGWDHVSVSRKNRCPNWEEMEKVKRLFFKDDEAAMQLHVPPAQHINVHPYCLHLWRPNDGREIPLPDPIMVGAERKTA
jgi:hypothetical protein